MPLVNIVSTIMLLAGSGVGYLAVVEPKDLEGLGPTALLALITLAALGTLVYLMKNFIPVLTDLVKEIAKNTASTTELVVRHTQEAADAREVVQIAAKEAREVVQIAAKEAREIIQTTAETAKTLLK